MLLTLMLTVLYTLSIILIRVAMETLNTFLLCAKYDKILEDLGDSWDFLDSRDQNPDVIGKVAKYVVVIFE